MEMSGQLHAPTVLTPGKEPLVPTGFEAGWAPEPVFLQEARVRQSLEIILLK